MPASSKSQQRFFGLLHAIQTGKIKAPSKHLAEKAKEISEQDVKDFAATKHEGLPARVKASSIGARMAQLAGKGMSALGRGGRLAAGGAQSAARYAARVPEGQRFFSTPAAGAGRTLRLLFNPNLGKYGNAVKGTAWAAMLAPPAMAAYNGAQAVLHDVQEGLNKATEAGFPVDKIPAGQWAQQLVHKPLPWLWRALTRQDKPPLERFADQQVFTAVKNKSWQALHDMMPFKGNFSDYVGLLTRPGVTGVKQIADAADWVPNPKTVNPAQSLRELYTALQNKPEAQ